MSNCKIAGPSSSAWFAATGLALCFFGSGCRSTKPETGWHDEVSAIASAARDRANDERTRLVAREERHAEEYKQRISSIVLETCSEEVVDRVVLEAAKSGASKVEIGFYPFKPARLPSNEIYAYFDVPGSKDGKGDREGQFYAEGKKFRLLASLPSDEFVYTQVPHLMNESMDSFFERRIADPVEACFLRIRDSLLAPESKYRSFRIEVNDLRTGLRAGVHGVFGGVYGPTLEIFLLKEG